MLRVKIRKSLLLGLGAFFLLGVLGVNWRLQRAVRTDLPDADDAAFRDLEGSLTILDPLIIHKKPNSLPPPPPLHHKPHKPKDDNVPDDIFAIPQPKVLPNFKNPCWWQGSGPERRLRCLPYFNLIGVDKSGTTDLWHRLTQHPDILEMGGVLGKETHWWSWRRFGYDIWTKKAKVQHFPEYLDAFDKPALEILKVNETVEGMADYHRLVTGEGSPTVFWDFTGWELLPQNRDKTVEQAIVTPHCMHHIMPHVKILIILRNPTDRLYSDYLFLQLFRQYPQPLTAESFHRDVKASIAMLEHCKQQHTLKQCLYNKTLHMDIPVRIMVNFYAMYLEQWLKVFPRDNILILRNEDYSKDIRGHIAKVFDFLDIRKLSDASLDRIANQSRAYTRKKEHRSAGQMLPETRKLLDEYHREPNMELAKLLADDRFTWSDYVES